MEHAASDAEDQGAQPQQYYYCQRLSPRSRTDDAFNTLRKWKSMTSFPTIENEYKYNDFQYCLPTIPPPAATSYHEDEIAKFRRNCEEMDQMKKKNNNLSMLLHRHGSDIAITSFGDHVDTSTLTPLEKHPDPPLEKDLHTNYCPEHDNAYSSPLEDGSHHSLTNSNCERVEGRLVDLTDNEFYAADNGSDHEGGIEILAESTEEECQEYLFCEQDKNTNHDCQVKDLQSTSLEIDVRAKKYKDLGGVLSMYENDSIVVAAIARVNENNHFVPLTDEYESADFEQLLREADDSTEDGRNSENIDHQYDDIAQQSFWQRRNPFSLSRSNAKTQPQHSYRDAINRNLIDQPPIRARSMDRDKYVVEIDILFSDAHSSSSSEIIDIMNVMANMELLHLWFDPVPAIFETIIKDGSTYGLASPRTSQSNSVDENINNNFLTRQNRQHDGQWVEISTPPLKIPPGAYLSGCSRSVRIAIRSLIGFPARIRSMIFVERSCGRMGMTLGPYPDGILCSSGTMAYHTFNVRVSEENEVGQFGVATMGNSSSLRHRRRVVISDEVRLQRDQDDDFNVTNKSCCLCFIIRLAIGLLERTIFFRWYKPDLASFMQQTISSMEKLRSLVQRGEAAAYHDGELVVGDEECQGGSENRSLYTSLLG